MRWLLDQEPNKAFKVQEVRSRRSLTQNAYYWALLGQLAAKMGMGHTELHRHMLREYGAYEIFSVREDVPFEQYFRYCELLGEGTVNGRVFKHVRVFKGSSQMDSREFSRLLEGMRQECILQGIQVMTPQEIAALDYVESKE
ncbi:MAG: hypothetical protein IJ586_00065 [Alloprevotella sp.]|nr:hypothetical protein [Alloprevotella sp.]